MSRAEFTEQAEATARSMATVLKDRAKALGLSQKMLAKRVGIPLPTVKRWLSGRGLSLDSYLGMMQTLDLSLADVSGIVSQNSATSFQYSEKQEAFFAGNPGYLAYFDHLLSGATPASIRRKFKLTLGSNQKYLRHLEKLGLIEVHPGDKVKLRVRGEPTWRIGGVLARTFKRKAILDFLEKARTTPRMYLHDYTDADFEQVQHHLSELSRLASAADKRGKLLPSQSKPYALLIGLDVFKWELLNRVPNI